MSFSGVRRDRGGLTVPSAITVIPVASVEEQLAAYRVASARCAGCELATTVAMLGLDVLAINGHGLVLS